MVDTPLVPDVNDPTVDDPAKGDPPKEDVSGKTPDPNADKGDPPADIQEIEIVHTGDAGSQPGQDNAAIRRRVRELKAKNKATESRATQSDARVELLTEEVRLLKLGSQLQAEDPKLPNPNDYEDGHGDPKFRADYDKYTQGTIEKAVKQHIPAPVQPDTSRKDLELERVQSKHYDRAEKLGVSDYAEAENIAVGILGDDNANVIMRISTHSDKVLYHLGKNPEKAHYFADLSRTDPGRAIAEIGALGAELKPQPKAKAKPAPDPDEELVGASPPNPDTYDSDLDKLRVAAQATGDMSKILAFKKKHAELAATS